jgi:RNA polymerase sigma factor (TIGR02999 family)
VVNDMLNGENSADVTVLLREWSAGSREAFDRLVPVVYGELGRIARRNMGARQEDTLQPTALVHEVYVRLCGAAPVTWQNRMHFFAVAGQVMRRVLVDHYRAGNAKKRGSGFLTVTLDESLAMQDMNQPDIMDLDAALSELAEFDAQQAKIVELRFFVGLSIDETASALDISPATVKRDWAVAKAWIYRRLTQR